jgi:hypothetical protein
MLLSSFSLRLVNGFNMANKPSEGQTSLCIVKWSSGGAIPKGVQGSTKHGAIDGLEINRA